MRLFQIPVSAVQTIGHDVGVPGSMAVTMGQQGQASRGSAMWAMAMAKSPA